MRVPRIVFASMLTALVGLGGPATRSAHAVFLSSLVDANGNSTGATVASGEFVFSNFTYLPPAGPPAPGDVTITPYTDSSGFNGIQIGGAFQQTGVGAADIRLGYTVTDTLGARITDVHLDGNPFVSPADANGNAIVTETVSAPGVGIVAAGQINANSPPGSQMTTLALNPPGPYATLTVTKDILLTVAARTGTPAQGSDVASVSFVDQTFSVVPEPAGVVMMSVGVGICGLACRRRMAVKA